MYIHTLRSTCKAIGWLRVYIVHSIDANTKHASGKKELNITLVIANKKKGFGTQYMIFQLKIIKEKCVVVPYGGV